MPIKARRCCKTFAACLPLLFGMKIREGCSLRDPFGIKPLYYADDGFIFRSASQVRALLKSKVINSSPDAAGHVGFFLWGSVPGHILCFKASGSCRNISMGR